MNKDGVSAAFFVAHLADRLHEGQRFDITDSSADLDNLHIGLDARLRLSNRGFDLVRNVRNDLDRLAEIIAAAFLFDDRKINAAAGPVIRLRKLRVREPLVMTQVEVRFGAVVGHKDLAVLKRRHRTGIDIDIRIELHHLHLHPACFEKTSDGTCREAFSKTRNNTARYKMYLLRSFFTFHVSASLETIGTAGDLKPST